jgi:uncharacterized protein YukE
MDIAGVRQMAQQLNQKADEIQNIMNQLTQVLNGTQWVGPDRERFLQDWQSQHCAALQRVISGLQDASQRATQNAAQQEQASNA